MTESMATTLQHGTTHFVNRYYLTAAGISATTAAGPNLFMLKQHTQDNRKNKINVATLEIWSVTSANFPSHLPIENRPFFPLKGFWAPQGNNIKIPVKPGPSDPKFVFTPDFTGCSMIIDKIDRGNYQVYHVQGGNKGGSSEGNHTSYMDLEYNTEDHGLGLVYSKKFDGYGTASNPRAFIFMKYDLTIEKWCVYIQSQNGLGVAYDPRTESIIAPSEPSIRSHNMEIVDLA